LLKTEALPIGSTGAEPGAVLVEGAGMIDLQPNCNHLAARSGQLRPSPVNTTDTGPLAASAQLAIAAMSRCGAMQGKSHRNAAGFSAVSLPRACDNLIAGARILCIFKAERPWLVRSLFIVTETAHFPCNNIVRNVLPMPVKR
jgi:hypothetical protein